MAELVQAQTPTPTPPHAHMHTCTHMRTHAHMHACTHAHMHTCTCTSKLAPARPRMRVRTRACACVRVCMHVRTSIRQESHMTSMSRHTLPGTMPRTIPTQSSPCGSQPYAHRVRWSGCPTSSYWRCSFTARVTYNFVLTFTFVESNIQFCNDVYIRYNKCGAAPSLRKYCLPRPAVPCRDLLHCTLARLG